MRKFVRIILLGLAVWALPFALGMAIFPIVPPETALFDTLMCVAMAFAATLFATVHLSRCAQPSLDEGLLAGAIWMAMAIALDVPLFIFGPDQMRMAPADYMADIGFTYAMIPIIAAGIGRALRR
jgi:NO-binding membrane sensor protein with MHYT domain